LKRESTRVSQTEETVTYHPTTQTTAVEEWVLDTTYGYFSCPSNHPEPVHTKDCPVSRKTEASPSQPRQHHYEGYSFFGI
jgi:hypothetical protein